MTRINIVVPVAVSVAMLLQACSPPTPPKNFSAKDCMQTDPSMLEAIGKGIEFPNVVLKNSRTVKTKNRQVVYIAAGVSAGGDLFDGAKNIGVWAISEDRSIYSIDSVASGSSSWPYAGPPIPNPTDTVGDSRVRVKVGSFPTPSGKPGIYYLESMQAADYCVELAYRSEPPDETP